MIQAGDKIEDRFTVRRVMYQSRDGRKLLLSVEERAVQAGFDMFTASKVPSRRGTLFICKQPSDAQRTLVNWRDWRAFKAEGLSDMFNCGVLTKPEEYSGALFALFEHGSTLLEKLESLPVANIKACACSLLHGLKTLQQRGLALDCVELDSVLCAEGEWKIIPGESLHKGDSFLENARQAAQLFIDLLLELDVTFDEGLRELLNRCVKAESNESVETAMAHNLWVINSPEESVPRPALRRQGSCVNIKWTPPELGEMNLYNITDFSLPEANSLIFTSDLALWGDSIPLDAQNGSAQITLSSNRIESLAPVLVFGPWARVGTPFFMGGPEDATLFNAYINDSDLTLEIEWPENINNVRIIARPDRFAHNPKDFHNGGKMFTHQKFTPLKPKWISLLEFPGWEKIYIQIFSQVNQGDKIVFSLGQTKRSRNVFPR